MSGHATSASADLAANNHMLPTGGRDAETLSENYDGRMSQVGQPTERRNGKGTLGGMTPYAAGPTDSDSDSDEEQQNQLTQLPDGRKPRRWITRKEWTDYIQEDHLRNRPSCVVSIFRVPKLLKGIKKKAYVPQRVSLGPQHHGSAKLPPMGHHKGRALHKMMTTFNINRTRTGLNTNMGVVIKPNNMDYANLAMEEILKLEDDIRNSYEEKIDCNGKTLARMLSLDGCFLLQVLRTVGGASVPEAMKRYDPIFGEEKLGFAARDILLDILMLENQIPLVVLRKLLELELNSAVNVEERLLHLLVNAASFFLNSLYDENIDIEQWSWPRPTEEVPHLLGFLHTVISYPPSSTHDERVGQGDCKISIDCCCSRQCILMLQGKKEEQNDTESIPHAVELINAGIKFSPLQRGCIKQIKFDENSATIFLPPISIMDDTKGVFRNLIAYEMCKPFEINYVSSYVALMDDLIDSEQDVALLRRKRVLSNGLGSDKEVADLFNGLCKGVTVDKEHVFNNLAKKVRAHYNNEMKVQIGKLVHDHFSSPWKALALAATVVLLLLAAVQTICSIISVYKSP